MASRYYVVCRGGDRNFMCATIGCGSSRYCDSDSTLINWFLFFTDAQYWPIRAKTTDECQSVQSDGRAGHRFL